MKTPIQIIVFFILLLFLNSFLSFGNNLNCTHQDYNEVEFFLSKNKATDFPLSSFSGQRNSYTFANPSFIAGVSVFSEKPPYRMSIELMQKQFEAGFEASGFLHDFAYALESHELPYIEVVNKYLSLERKKKRLLSSRNQKFVFHFAVNAQTEALDILLREKLSFAENYGLQNIDKKIKTALFNSTIQAAFTKNNQLFKRVKQLTKKAELNDYPQFLYILESKYFEYLKDWKSYVKVTYDFMEKYDDSDPIFLNNQAISILKVVENKETLKEAKKWTEKSIFLDPQEYNHQTYAYILYRLGDVKAAKIAASKALKYNRPSPSTKLKVTIPNSPSHKSRDHLKT